MKADASTPSMRMSTPSSKAGSVGFGLSGFGVGARDGAVVGSVGPADGARLGFRLAPARVGWADGS